MEKPEVIKVVPSIFAQGVYLLDGSPFRLKDRDYLLPIYDSDISEGMIMSGRQVEKSTTEAVHMANHTLLIPHFKALYFAPLTDQVRVFSKERIGKLYQYSQSNNIIKRDYTDTSCSKAVGVKDFTNGSVNYFRHCYEYGDNIRGITCNGLWGDEIQDIHIDAIPVIRETQSHALDTGAKKKVTWFTGTPKTYSNTIQQYWDRSTQNEWVIKCQHCKTYQIMGTKNLTPKAFICRKCKKDIDKSWISNGMWYELQPDRKLKGFRISQLMVPWVTAEDIWDKYTTYPTDKFMNEVLGRSYENATKPFNEVILNKITDQNMKFYNRAENIFANTNIFMGVDWGKGEKSFTVMVIFSYNQENKFQLLFAKVFRGAEESEPDYQTNYIGNMMHIFKVAHCIVDWGFGFVQYKQLIQDFGSRVSACYYSFNQKKEVNFDPYDRKWVVSRTKVIQNYVKAVHDRKVLWPAEPSEVMRVIKDHHLAELAEYRKSQNGRSEDLMFTHPEGMPDDGLHACVYAYLAATIHSNLNKFNFYSAYGQNI